MRLEIHSLRIEWLRQVHSEQGAEICAKILLRIRQCYLLGKLFQGHIEELLNDLIADDALLRPQGFADQLYDFPAFTTAVCSNE